MKIFVGHVNFKNHVPDGHVNQMLNVKPWNPQEQISVNFKSKYKIFPSKKMCLQIAIHKM